MAKVAAIRSAPETVLSDVERLCELAGMSGALAKNRTTILRSSVASLFPSPGLNTTPWQLEAAIAALASAGYADVVAIEGALATREVDLNDYGPIFKKRDVPVLRAFDPADVKWVAYRPKGRMHVLHKIFPDGIRVPDLFFGKNVFHLPTMKPGADTTIRGALENALDGLLPSTGPQARLRVRASIHRVLVDLLAIQKEIHEGLFAIVDGTTVESGAAPAMPVVKGYLLAGADPVAVDAVAAKMMGFDPLAIESIRVAHDDKLGVGDPRDIELVGDDVSKENWGWKAGPGRAASLRHLETLAARTPFRRALEAGGDAYRAYYQWPLKDKRVFDAWKKGTAWGRLFGAYERGESERVMHVHAATPAKPHPDTPLPDTPLPDTPLPDTPLPDTKAAQL